MTLATTDHAAAVATLATQNHSVANTLKQGLTRKAGPSDHASVVWLDGIPSGSRGSGTHGQLAGIGRGGHAGRTGKRCVTENHTRSHSYSCSPTPSLTSSSACAFSWGRNQSPNDRPSPFTFNRFFIPGPTCRLDARNGRVRCAHPADTPTNRFSASRDYLHCDIRSWVNAGNGHPPDGHRYPPPLFIPFNTLASQRSAGLHRRDHDCPWAHADLHDRLQPFELTSRSFQISGKCSLEVSCPPLNLNLPLCSRNFI